VQAYPTMTRSLLALADRLRSLGVTRVVMEATSDYWKPVFYVLEAAGLETWLVNARDVKHLPDRPKTDKLDCIWPCKVAERQMIRPSCVPPPEIPQPAGCHPVPDRPGRGPHRGEAADREAARGCIKLSVVASDIFGTSGRDMMNALVAGERSPKALAQLARTRMRRKMAALVAAFTGHVTDHHAFLLPGCSPASTAWTPTSPGSTSGSRR
jgi:transposase